MEYLWQPHLSAPEARGRTPELIDLSYRTVKQVYATMFILDDLAAPSIVKFKYKME